MNINIDKLLTRKQAAAYLGVKENTLAVWSSKNRYKLKSLKIGRLVRYRQSDLIQFANANSANSHSEV
ncbi:MAG: helix-turn-helix domain-containing protein [Proteobacteria bacterium]|nr:helix-turn-helix domain-containing protein [Pseudomonadota bacterium]